MNKSQRSGIVWLACGQGVTALGTLLGVRLLTQFVEPSTYGAASLGLGIVAMAMNLSSTPLIQAAMHFYPQFLQRGQLSHLAKSLHRSLKTVAICGLPVICIGAAAYVALSGESVALPLVLAALLVAEICRSLQLSMLNSARRHRRYVAWIASDAWARPLLASAAVIFFWEDSTIVLGAHLVASVAVTLVLATQLWSVGTAAPTSEPDYDSGQTQLDRRMWLYAVPLIPVAIISWLSNIGDRYIIAGMLSLSDAGMYAAAYGLASAPFIAMNTAAEQAMRPLYQQAVSAGDHCHSDRLLRSWLLGLALGGSLGVLAMTLFHTEIARLFLGGAFRQISAAMPWIAAGYAVRSIAYVFERVCYAHGHTRRVLVAQLSGAVAALVTASIGTWQWGLLGAAMAVPVYFAIQLATAMILARGLVGVCGSTGTFPSSATQMSWRGSHEDAT